MDHDVGGHLLFFHPEVSGDIPTVLVVIKSLVSLVDGINIYPAQHSDPCDESLFRWVRRF